MSPKSRGRRKEHGQKKPVRRSPRPLRLSDQMLRDARQVVGEQDVLMAEVWASQWLGESWLAASIGDREAEQQLCTEVVGRASTNPSAHGLAAIAALARVAPQSETKMLAETIAILAKTQPLPSWHGDPAWTPVSAWRAVDVWDAERVLFIEYEGPRPHTLMAQLIEIGGLMVERLAVLEPGAAAHWDELRDADEVPMPVAEQPVGEILADLAGALRKTDMTLPRNDDPDFIGIRSLAWSRCHGHLPPWPEYTPLPDSERERLISEFATGSDVAGRDVARSLADLFLDYGDGYIGPGPLCWSPGWVMLFLTDWLPRKAVLDEEQRAALPEALRRWVRFVLERRGVGPQWITPVVEAVDEHLPGFLEAFDDEASWGPAKQIAAELATRGVDIEDRQAVTDAISALNAERLARRLMDE